MWQHIRCKVAYFIRQDAKLHQERVAGVTTYKVQSCSRKELPVWQYIRWNFSKLLGYILVKNNVSIISPYIPWDRPFCPFLASHKDRLDEYNPHTTFIFSFRQWRPFYTTIFSFTWSCKYVLRKALKQDNIGKHEFDSDEETVNTLMIFISGNALYSCLKRNVRLKHSCDPELSPLQAL